MKRHAAILGLALGLWFGPAQAQEVVLQGEARRLAEPVVKQLKQQLGIDYRTESNFHFNVRVVRGSEPKLTWRVSGYDGITKENLLSKLGRTPDLKSIQVTVSSATLNQLHPGGLRQLDRTLSETRRAAEREVQRLVEELPAFRKAATPNFISPAGNLILRSGIYGELVYPVEEHVRQKLGKTKGEYFSAEVEVEVGRSRKLEITPVEGKPGVYRVVIGQSILARIAKQHLRVDANWLSQEFNRQRSGEATKPTRPEPRFQEFVEWNKASMARQAEAKAAFDGLIEKWASGAVKPAEAARVRGLRIEFDAFEEIGVRAKPMELFKRGHVEMDFGEEVRRFKHDTLNVEDFYLERVAEQGKTPAARRAILEAAFAKMLSSYRPVVAGRSRVPQVERKATLEATLDAHRRADKTVDWKAAAKAGAFRQVGGAAHFAMALFLKELAVTVQTGDPQRLDEFFDFLTTTDFFVEYGLFAAGAQVGTVAYNRFLARHVKPTFVSGILRTNLVLATGMALPELVHGRFDGKAFAIDLGSLGLSATAVKTAVEGIRWVTNLKQAEQAGRLARASTGMRRLARAGGWFYTVAETAVVLYLGDAIAQRVRAHLDEEQAREELGEATLRFVGRSLDPAATERSLEEALLDFAAAQSAYRDFLYRGLDQHGQTYASRLAKAARQAKLLADEQQTLVARLKKLPALKQRIVARHGSVDAYLASQQQESSAALEAQLAEAMQTFERGRKAELEQVYGRGRREGPFALDLSDAAKLRWLGGGGEAGADGDPYDGRTDLLARRGRDAERRAFVDAAGAVSDNRLQAYADERAVLSRVRAHLSPALRAVLDRHVKQLASLESRERELFGMVSPGLAKTLQRAGR